MSSLYPQITPPTRIYVPTGSVAPIIVFLNNLTHVIMAGGTYAGSRVQSVFNKLLKVINVDVIGQISGFYKIPKGFKPTKIFCDDAGIVDIAWILESSTKPGYIVFMYDPADNPHRSDITAPLYFHNLTQMHLTFYGQIHGGHSPYSYWKIFGGLTPICNFLKKNTNPGGSKVKLWVFKQKKIAKMFYDPKFVNNAKLRDKHSIEMYRMIANPIGKVVSACVDSNGNESLNMEPYLKWVTPSGLVLGNYLHRIQ